MKNISIILLFISLLNCQAVELSKFDFKSVEIEVNKEFKVTELKQIEHWLIDFLKTYPFSFLEDDEILNNFHFVDFSGDGRLDIIYYGASGSEPFITILFEKFEDNYNETFSFYGSIDELYQPIITQPAILKMYEQSCCEDNNSSIQLYYPSFEKGRFSYNLVEKINFSDKTLFAEKNDIRINFTVVNESYKLRSTPEIIEGDDDNTVAVYGKGAKGIALSEVKDNTRRIWWFVIMDKNSKPISSNITSGNNNESEFHCLGWMSSRYLEY